MPDKVGKPAETAVILVIRLMSGKKRIAMLWVVDKLILPWEQAIIRFLAISFVAAMFKFEHSIAEKADLAEAIEGKYLFTFWIDNDGPNAAIGIDLTPTAGV